MHKQLKIFLIMISFFILVGEMLSPIYAIYVEEIGGGIITAGTAWSIFMLISGSSINSTDSSVADSWICIFSNYHLDKTGVWLARYLPYQTHSRLMILEI